MDQVADVVVGNVFAQRNLGIDFPAMSVARTYPSPGDRFYGNTVRLDLPLLCNQQLGDLTALARDKRHLDGDDIIDVGLTLGYGAAPDKSARK